jgi:hypothetical protein
MERCEGWDWVGESVSHRDQSLLWQWLPGASLSPAGRWAGVVRVALSSVI